MSTDDEPILDGELDDDDLVDAELDDAEDESSEGEPSGASGERYRWVLSKNAKLRLDKYLQNRIRSISRNKLQELIELKMVLVNDQPAKPSTKLHEGDVVTVVMPPRPAYEIVPENIPVEVLYEDDDMIVVNKPADLIVHPARGIMTGTLLNALAFHFQHQNEERREKREERTEAGDAPDNDPSSLISPPSSTASSLSSIGSAGARPGVVHRLDKNTTGVIVVAKRDETHWKISKQFENRTNLKCYLAVVHGCPEPIGGAVEEPIGRHPTIAEAMSVRHDSQGRHALTLYRVRERYRGYSLIELELKTGRTHQIRVHMEYIGHPLVGDIIYGGEPIGPPELDNPPHPKGGRPFLNYATTKPEGLKIYDQIAARGDVIMGTPALHATLLQIKHPVTEQVMTFTAPVHSPMIDLITELRKRPAPGPVVERGWWVNLEEAAPAD